MGWQSSFVRSHEVTVSVKPYSGIAGTSVRNSPPFCETSLRESGRSFTEPKTPLSFPSNLVFWKKVFWLLANTNKSAPFFSLEPRGDYQLGFPRPVTFFAFAFFCRESLETSSKNPLAIGFFPMRTGAHVRHLPEETQRAINSWRKWLACPWHPSPCSGSGRGGHHHGQPGTVV